MAKGIIIKGIGGLYLVKTDDGVLECRARGIFRKEKKAPMIGDYVEVTANETNTIDEIYPRRNSLVRPPLANIDQLVIIIAAIDPSPSILIIDKLIAIAENKGIEPIIVLNKLDLANVDELVEIYTKAGFTVICRTDDNSINLLKEALTGKVSAFTGNSGVGKSSILNLINSELELPVGETSKKLGRGRHTTRHVELFELVKGGLVADTPGFSSVEIEQYEVILKDDLQYSFREFLPHIGKCKYTGCSHTKEKGCKILELVEKGEIGLSRHNSYCTFYEAVKDKREWEFK
jgi:ribosome biogenesis GTPase